MKFKDFFEKNWKELILFVATILPTTLIKIWYLNINKVLWWDEAVFMLQANHFAFGTINTGWWAGKGFLLPAMLSVIVKLGGGELGAKVLMLVFSTASLVLIYLISRKFFDQKIALIATAFASFIWLELFYVPKILSDIPSVFFSLLGIYFLFSGFKECNCVNWIKSQRIIDNFGPMLAGVSFVLAGMIRFNAWIFLPFVLIGLLFFEKKKILYFLIGFLIAFSAYSVVSYVMYGNPVYEITEYFTMNVGKEKISDTSISTLFSSYPDSVSWVVFILALTGIFFAFKKKKVIFLVITAFGFMIPYLFAINFDLRYGMYVYPLVAVLGAVGLSKIANLVKIEKYLWILAIVAVIFVAYLQVLTATNQLEMRSNSYIELKQASEWLVANSNPDDVVMSASQPQIVYYSGLNTILIPETESEFESVLISEQPKYIVLSGYEKHPDYLANVLQDNVTFKPVTGFNIPGTDQTIVVITEVTE